MALEVIEADMLAALPELAADGVRFHSVVMPLFADAAN